MIANPLVWSVSFSELGCCAVAGNYTVVQGNEGPAEAVGRGIHLGKHDTFADAQDACERHHQVAYVRGLTRQTIDKIQYNTNDCDDAVFEIIEAAYAADRAEQLAKAGAT